MCLRRINSKEELSQFYNNVRGLLDVRNGEIDTIGKKYISVCGGTGCCASDALLLCEELKKEAIAQGVQDQIEIAITGCFGFCQKGPIVKISPEHTFYTQVKVADAQDIISQHIVKGEVLERLLYVNPMTNQTVESQDQIPFYQKQHRIALRNCGLINPEEVRDYIATRGFQALAQAITEMTPEEVIDLIKKSGLRGRGGGGFPTGLKWEIARKNRREKNYIICNADEGDPGAFMDRSIMEGDPYSVIEAMAIGGYATGSDEGIVYIRAEYPLAVERLKIAIEQAEKIGLLGKNILGTDFNFTISIKYGAGAFVCGEETALIHSIEGERGVPTNKPPYPAVSGLFGQSTNVNNVETYANIPYIFLEGADKFNSIGTSKSKGTKVFALAGKINNVGLVEVPMGTTLREIIYDIGGGIPDGRVFKAAQTGGPSGGCLVDGHLDLPIDYDNLSSIGSMMGSGGLIIMDDKNCMVDIAKFYLEFTVEESCGKCTPCRIGNMRLLETLTRITKGEGKESDIKALKDLSKIIQDTALCGLGQSAPNPVLSTLAHFEEEYKTHIIQQYCPAKVCRDLARYEINPSQCIGCGICAKKCPVEAIHKTDVQAKNPKLFIHEIEETKCIRCGVCALHCPVKAISI